MDKKSGKQPRKEFLTREEFKDYLLGRRLELFGGRSQPFADALGISRQRFSDLLAGRYGLSPEVRARLNEIDPKYTLEPGEIIRFKVKK